VEGLSRLEMQVSNGQIGSDGREWSKNLALAASKGFSRATEILITALHTCLPTTMFACRQSGLPSHAFYPVALKISSSTLI
jgi:hypothetical protein